MTGLPDGAVVDEEVLEEYSRDRSGAPAGRARAIVFAESAAHVSSVVQWASAERVPVVPRGAGTGLAGGAVAAEGSVIVDLSRLNRISSIDPVDQIAVVEPGVVTADLDAAARRHGLFFAPDPASADSSSVGGNIATNAGGLRCVKYGVTGDSVLGLTVALADGRLLQTGRSTRKGVTGYDLTSLFVGSEGTLGVIVGATVRLTPVPWGVVTISATFADVEAAATACAAVSAQRLTPSMLELLDERTLRTLDASQGTALSEEGGALVIAQVDGTGSGADATALTDLLGETARHVERADDQSDAEALMAARRQALPSIQRTGHTLIEDICVPRSRLAEGIRGVELISTMTGVTIHTFAHAGDGNLHPIISWQGEPDPPEYVHEAAGRVFQLALDLGGTLTGEHGIGVLKRAWVGAELGETGLSVHRAIKASLDPLGILNPGKAF
nr:FAD-linked oxidase [Gordonia sp. NB41Y]